MSASRCPGWGEYRYCIDGRETLCEKQHNTGYSIDGGFAEYAVANARFAVPVLKISIFETVLKGLSIVSSIVGTRQDLAEVFALHATGIRVLTVERTAGDAPLSLSR